MVQLTEGIKLTPLKLKFRYSQCFTKFPNSLGTIVFNPWVSWPQLEHGKIYLGNKIDPL
jgi:hypothetical protein